MTAGDVFKSGRRQDEMLKSKYIVKEFFVNLLFALVLLFFLFSLESLLRVIDLLIRGTFTGPVLLKFFMVTLGSIIPYVVPLAFLCAAISLFTRLTADREILVLLTGGIRPLRLLPWLLLTSGLVSFGLFFFNQYLLPRARLGRREIVHQARSGNPLSLLRERMSVATIPGFSIYVGQVKGRRLEKVVISFEDASKQLHLLQASSATASVGRTGSYLEFDLKDGWLLVTAPAGKREITRMEFVRYRLRVPLPEQYQQKIQPRPMEMTRTQLRQGEPDLEKALELTRRHVFAFAPLIFVLIGSGLGLHLRHRNRGFHIGLGAMVGLSFFEIMTLGEFLAHKGQTLWLWLPVFIFAAFSLLLWRQQ